MADVIVYSTNTCPYCVMAKQWLKEKSRLKSKCRTDQEELEMIKEVAKWVSCN